MRLRPLGAGETLDLAARAYQALGRPMLAAVAGPTLCCLAGFMFFWSYAFPSFWSTKDPSSTSIQVTEAAVAMGMGLFIAAPLFLLGVAYSMILSTHLVSDFMVGNVPNVAAAKRAARTKLKGVFGLLARQVMVLAVFGIVAVILLALSALLTQGTANNDLTPAFVSLLATVAIAVSIVWIPVSLCRDGLAPAAMVLENLGSREAVRRSRSLLWAEGRHTSGYDAMLQGIILMAFLYLLGAWGLMALASEAGIGSFLADNFVGSAWTDILDTAFAYSPWFLVIWVTIPFWSTLGTILYFERRVRKEGFDIEVLAQDVWRTDKNRRFQL